MSTMASRYRWSSWGDLNAFFGLMLDNLTNLVLLWGLLAPAGFDQGVFFQRMVPGTALGVLVGDLIYTWMAIRLARRTGRTDVTAMPLGLDTPSTIGIGLAVFLPAFLLARQGGMSSVDASLVAWKVGMATLVLMGVVKLIASFAGGWIGRIVPQAGLLGSLAGIGITLLGFLPFKEVLSAPIVGLIALGLVLYTLVARFPLPGRFPGAFAAVLAATVAYYLLGLVTGTPDLSTAFASWPGVHWPMPTLSWTDELGTAIRYLPIGLPFGLLTIVGGINVTESARCAGDDYSTRDILLTEAVATLIAGVCGGAAQSTPYIGHPAYKAMGARAGYTLATGLFVGIGGALGIVSWTVALIPAAAVAPILLFVGMEITGQAYQVCKQRYYPAIFMALLPVVGELGRILLGQLLADPGVRPTSAGSLELLGILSVLGHGFIITAMLWGAAVASLTEGRMMRSAGFLAAMALLTAFGFTHSVRPDGDIYLPWMLGAQAGAVWRLSLAYLVLAAMMALLGLRGRAAPATTQEGDCGR